MKKSKYDLASFQLNESRSFPKNKDAAVYCAQFTKKNPEVKFKTKTEGESVIITRIA